MGRCARWSWTARRRPCGSPSCRCPSPDPGPVLLKVRACGVCRTDLHVRRRRGARRRGSPLVLGHQIVGERVDTGERVGVPWLGWTDGTCRYCTGGQENLCVARALHRQGPRRRLRRVHGRRRALLPAFARRDRRRPRRAAALRRADRPAHAARRRRPGARRDLRLRQRGAPDLPDRRLGGPRRVRLHAAGRRAHAGVRAVSGAIWAGGTDERPEVELDAATDLRPSRRARAARAARGAPGRDRGLRRDPHERHPARSPMPTSGASARCARSPTSRAPTATSCSRSRRACRCARR